MHRSALTPVKPLPVNFQNMFLACSTFSTFDFSTSQRFNPRHSTVRTLSCGLLDNQSSNPRLSNSMIFTPSPFDCAALQTSACNFASTVQHPMLQPAAFQRFDTYFADPGLSTYRLFQFSALGRSTAQSPKPILFRCSDIEALKRSTSQLFHG